MYLLKNGILQGARLLLFSAALLACFLILRGQSAIPQYQDEPMEVHFLKTQNDADAIVFLQGKSCAVIDTGESEDAQTLIDFLLEREITNIDLLILTHPDKDHIGGAGLLLENFSITRVAEPHYTKSSEKGDELELLNQRFRDKSVQVIIPTHSRSFRVGEMKFIVYPPLEKYYNKDNNYSLAVLAVHKSVNLLLAGDAEEKRLLELTHIHWPEIHLYKAAHHGRASTSTGDFIRLLSPGYLVCTASGSDSVIQEVCGEIGTPVYYTGNGTVSFLSDGQTIAPIQ